MSIIKRETGLKVAESQYKQYFSHKKWDNTWIKIK